MKISVVIATLHRENDLQILLESFLHQIIKPFEIIIVDQSDNDNTKNLCNDYQYKLPLKYHHFSIKSTTTTRNFGVKQAKGDVIAFLDDDTKLMPDYLYHIEEFYKEYPNAIGGMGKILNPNPMADRL
ncbi:MAG: glycosyltransferase family 2 protein, partial [Spirochaetota bacterium]|nr:glycosyltransferase family 2 protein [Spirochaetota bacterium]